MSVHLSLDDWDMRFDRNQLAAVDLPTPSLDDWDMRFDRNVQLRLLLICNPNLVKKNN